MAFTVVCKSCSASLHLQALPAKPTPVKCPKCSEWVVVEPAPLLLVRTPARAVAVPVAVALPAATALPPIVHPLPPVVHPLPEPEAEEWVSTGPMPKRPLNRSAVLGGFFAAGAVLYIFQAILAPLPSAGPGSSYWFSTLVSIVLAGIWGGHFAAAFAEDRKVRHSAQLVSFFIAVVLGLILSLGLARSLMTADNFDKLLSWLNWEFIGYLSLFSVALGFCFVLGGLTERAATAVARMLHERPQWKFRTADEGKIDAHGPWRYPTLAFFWSLCGWLFLITCWTPFLGGGAWYMQLLGCGMFLVLWRTCQIMARKRRSRSAREALAESSRPPIVYLRSFRHDGRRLQEGLWYAYTRMFLVLLARSPEELLARTLGRFGPFVGIGKPGEDLPELGAERMYVGDGDWQAVVSELLHRPGSMAVIQAGETQGLRWELGKVGRGLHPEQVLLFVPFAIWLKGWKRAAVYAEFRGWAEECLPTRLPDDLGASCFLYFTEGKAGRWRAHILHPTGELPEDHSLVRVFAALRGVTPLWPGSSGQLLRSALAVSLFFLIICGGCVSSMFNIFSNKTTEGPRSETPATQPAAEKVVRYEGKAKPYRISLPEGWTPSEPGAGQDLAFGAKPDLVVNVRLQEGGIDVSDHAERRAEGIRSAMANGKPFFGEVRIADRGTLRSGGEEWVWVIVEARAAAETVWIHSRAHSGPAGTVILTGIARADSPSERARFARILDSFEFPE